MQRLLLSLAVLTAVGGGAIASTGAFFSDTETSTGNVFTAGSIDLKIDSEQHYDGLVCSLNQVWVLPQGGTTSRPELVGQPCDGTWALTDLQDGVHKFFNFTDIKPGDDGENTISLHLDTNPAWVCADINVTANDDVTCTEPEINAEGVGTCENSLPSATMDGDLAQNLDFFAWLDQGATPGFNGDDVGEGDNIWQAGEPPLFSNVVGPLSDAIGGKHYALADSSTGSGPMPAGATNYIGLAWCAGDMVIGGPGVMSCNGATMGNDAQTDMATADVTFRVEQSRNNDHFLCNPPVQLPA